MNHESLDKLLSEYNPSRNALREFVVAVILSVIAVIAVIAILITNDYFSFQAKQQQAKIDITVASTIRNIGMTLLLGLLFEIKSMLIPRCFSSLRWRLNVTGDRENSKSLVDWKTILAYLLCLFIQRRFNS